MKCLLITDNFSVSTSYVQMRPAPGQVQVHEAAESRALALLSACEQWNNAGS